MKKPLCCALCACVLLCFLFGALADSTPLIYKVSDGEERYIFLLGTMHVINADTLPIARIDELMRQVDTVVFELDDAFFEPLIDASELPMAQRLKEARGEQPNRLSEALLDRLARFFTEDCGLDGIDADTLRYVDAYSLYTALLIEALRTADMDVSGAAVDKYVYEEAKARGLKTMGAETVDEQLDALDEYYGNILGAAPEADLSDAEIDAVYGEDPSDNEDDLLYNEEQFYYLMDNLSLVKLAMGMLCSAYNSGNRPLLMATVVNVYPRSDVDEIRNTRFFNAAKDRLDEGGRALIAVGLYHVLCEEDGLVRQFADAGYRVEQW